MGRQMEKDDLVATVLVKVAPEGTVVGFIVT